MGFYQARAVCIQQSDCKWIIQNVIEHICFWLQSAQVLGVEFYFASQKHNHIDMFHDKVKRHVTADKVHETYQLLWS